MNHSKQLRIAAVMIGMMIIAFIPAFSQNGVGINPTGAAADPSAMLDVSSTTKGILVPRMTAAQRAALVLPATGLMVFQTDGSTGYYFNTGTPVTPGWILVNDAAALTGTVPVVSGGTGAANANNARGNLGAAASGANSDITSLTGIVTPIAVDAGGSGTSFLTGYLKGNGGSPFTAVSTIPGSDVTGNISGNATNFTGSLSGDVSGTQTTTSVDMVGGVTSANVASGANAANAATNANTASTIVKRDASGNFSAGTVTADLTGNVTGNVSGTAANVTGTVAVPNGGTGATTLTGYVIGNGTSAMTDVSSIPGSDVSGNIPGNAANVTGVVAAANGGTGNSSYTIGDIIYASGASTLSKLADAATGNALISGGAGTAPSYGKIGLATHVSGTLPVANGGTGATSLTGMLKGNGTSAVSAVTGTANFAARWSDANTISTGKIQDNNTAVGINVAPTATEMLTSAGGASLSGINGTTTSATSGRYGVHGNGVAGADGYLGYVLAAGALGATTVTNPAVMGSVTSGSGPGLAGGTSGTATSAAIIGSSSVWNGGNFSSSLAGAICLVGSNTAAAGTGIGMGIFGQTNQRSTQVLSATIPTAGVVGYNGNGSLSGQAVGVSGNYSGAGYGSGVAGLGFGGTWVGTIANDVGVTGIVGTGGHAGVAGYYGTHAAVTAAAGVYGASSSTTVYAVRAFGSGGLTTSAGIFTNGTQTATGTKSAVVPTSKGYQKLYVTETPGVWFEDIGRGTLINGQVTISLDALFLETVHIDAQYPLHVFLQEEGESNGLIAIPGTNNFTVKEKNSGTSNISFTYRVMAKRKYYENYRFGNEVQMGENVDWSQYKDLPAIPVSYEEATRQLNYNPNPVKKPSASVVENQVNTSPNKK